MVRWCIRRRMTRLTLVFEVIKYRLCFKSDKVWKYISSWRNVIFLLPFFQKSCSKQQQKKNSASWQRIIATDRSWVQRGSKCSQRPVRRQEDSGTSKDVSRPGIEPGSQELASWAITARPPQHEITSPAPQSFWRVSWFLLHYPSPQRSASRSSLQTILCYQCNRRWQ